MIQTLALPGPFRIPIETPGGRFQRDAPPGHAFFGGAHHRPVLYLVKAASAAFAVGIALAGGANGNAGGVGCARIPTEPSVKRLARHGGIVALALVVVDHESVNRGQGAHFGACGDAVGRR